MVVPMARTPMMNSPPLKKPSTQIKGAGFADDYTTALAPVVVDALKNEAKNRIIQGKGVVCHKHIPVSLTRKQISKLKNGGAITISPSQISDMAQHALSLMPQQAQKVVNSALKDKGVRVALKSGEDLIDRMSGGSILGDISKSVKSVGRTAQSAAKASMPVVKDLARELGPVAIDALGDYAKGQLAGKGTHKGMMRKTARRAYMSGSGSPYISPAYESAMDYYSTGGSIYPAGSYGRGFAPAGVSGGNIQLGSPYQSVHSPAMNPFIATTGLAGYAPITTRSGRKVGGDTIHDIGRVADIGMKLAPLLAML